MHFGDPNTSGQPRHIDVHMRLQGVQLTTCLDSVATLLLLEGQKAPCTVIASVCCQTSTTFVLHWLAKKATMFQELL